MSIDRATAGAANPLVNNLLPVLAALLLAFFWGSTIFGAYHNYSPVPMIDSWSGMVDFYLKSRDSASVWWNQHNEHRILIPKLLFWLDMRYFGGVGLLLIPLQIVFFLSTWGVLTAFTKRLNGLSSWRESFLVSAVLGMLCSAWMQSENFIWSFQSQFILVYLFPLLSFYCLARALEAHNHALRWRVLSLIFGAASAYCMANGILVLPILVVLAWYGERSPRWFIIFALCAAASLAVFLIGYHKTFAGLNGIEKFKAEPSYVIKFALAYLGGPFYAIFGKIEGAIAAGGLSLVLALWFFLRRSVYRSQPFALALLAYVGYIFATAGVTAFGRVLFPLPFAASSRYLTPTLIMWSVLLILLLSRRRQLMPWSAVALVVSAALLLPGQTAALKIDNVISTPQAKAVAALGLQMDINDVGEKRRLTIFYDARIEEIFQRARKNKVSIFSERYDYPANQIGKPLQGAGGEPCSGQVTFSKLIDDKKVTYRVGGSLSNESAHAYRYILFGDEQGLVKGIAIPGRDIQGMAGLAGVLNFDGYLLGELGFVEMRCVD